MRQTKIPCIWMRGGTSKGAYFHAADLPDDVETRDKVLLAVMGSPDNRQIDGMGGADPLTSKVAIISRSKRPDADVDYLFAQVVVNEARVDTSPTCGNILAGVGPFAIDEGLIEAKDGETPVRIFMVNTESLCTAKVPTPGGEVAYDGEAKISGVPGTAAPIILHFLETEGSSCGSLLPSGNVKDVIDGVEVTMADNGMPVVLMRAADVGATGDEAPKELEAKKDVKAKIESIRLKCGPIMNLGDVTNKVVPKMTLLSPPKEGGAISTRTFIPHKCHDAIGVLGAVTVATGCVLPGSVGEGIAIIPEGKTKTISIEHPTGEFTVQLETTQENGSIKVLSAGLLRTARRLYEGSVLVPGKIWKGKQAALRNVAE